MVGCSCPTCLSREPKNERLRASGLLQWDGKNLLIDTGPDLRLQALRYGIQSIDGVLLTHTHFDHIAGIDELRCFYLLTREALPVLVSSTTFNDLQRRYDYLFKAKSETISLAAQLDFHLLAGESGQTQFLGLTLGFMTYFQGGMAVTGYRLGDFAYVTDLRNFDDSLFEQLKGVKTFVMSALSEKPTFMHLSFQEAIEFAKRVGAERTYFTHLSHRVDYQTINKALPPGFALAYDGLVLEIEDGS